VRSVYQFVMMLAEYCFLDFSYSAFDGFGLSMIHGIVFKFLVVYAL